MAHNSQRRDDANCFMTMRPIAKFCLVAIAYSLGVLNAGATEHKRVMILHSVGREFRPWNEYAKDIRAELDRQSPWPLDV